MSRQQNPRAQSSPRCDRRSRPVRLLTAAALAAATGLALPGPAAQAAPSTSVRCSVPDLVAAINRANSTPEADTIRLARTCTYELLTADPGSHADGLPAITSDITIDGEGATITRPPSAPRFRILRVGETGTLTLNSTTISGGRATDCPLFTGQGVCGGGIYSQGRLTVNHGRVVHNTANAAVDGVFAEGGGIDSDGTATVNDTEISHNSATYSGATPSSAEGGGIANDGALTLNRSRITDNTIAVTDDTGSFAFGAGHAAFALTTIEHSTIGANHARAAGGTALAALATGGPVPGETTTLTVTDSTIAGNTASAPHGLAVGGGVGTNFPVSLIRTRVIDNTATAPGGTARGGGIHIGRTGEITLRDSTVRNNTAHAPGGTAQGGGMSNATGGTARTERSHIGKNTADAPDGGTSQGGGVYSAVGSTTLTRGSVTDNRAAEGGGIFKESGTVTLNDTPVRGNHPDNCAPAGSVPGCAG
ncbi:hypothetical protein ACIRBY_33745 [Streptomyces sp. NPDC096136]|uniref:hypothetical protein n=1 Tax=Streptomyces sp. NPDC096136 TaxID=3366076 RepID=UPI0038066457